ncbi:hypothetical protein HXX76_014245 [Chlamydomonas incerta]|uniref:MLO-like protein n=1 Tax=Chlamydomonas incerta TaxID=51695 RepID=A0A835SD88_CHLIN|nr:hypothetical protein HXX76_014245 [Chlamydomonas incerta]|eukprot:KAG2424824.1 hypothetical protein HXX76_014245 [Chlamydomonas incerta]
MAELAVLQLALTHILAARAGDWLVSRVAVGRQPRKSKSSDGLAVTKAPKALQQQRRDAARKSRSGAGKDAPPSKRGRPQIQAASTRSPRPRAQPQAPAKQQSNTVAAVPAAWLSLAATAPPKRHEPTAARPPPLHSGGGHAVATASVAAALAAHAAGCSPSAPPPPAIALPWSGRLNTQPPSAAAADALWHAAAAGGPGMLLAASAMAPSLAAAGGAGGGGIGAAAPAGREANGRLLTASVSAASAAAPPPGPTAPVTPAGAATGRGGSGSSSSSRGKGTSSSSSSSGSSSSGSSSEVLLEQLEPPSAPRRPSWWRRGLGFLLRRRPRLGRPERRRREAAADGEEDDGDGDGDEEGPGGGGGSSRLGSRRRGAPSALAAGLLIATASGSSEGTEDGSEGGSSGGELQWLLLLPPDQDEVEGLGQGAGMGGVVPSGAVGTGGAGGHEGVVGMVALRPQGGGGGAEGAGGVGTWPLVSALAGPFVGLAEMLAGGRRPAAAGAGAGAAPATVVTWAPSAGGGGGGGGGASGGSAGGGAGAAAGPDGGGGGAAERSSQAPQGSQGGGSGNTLLDSLAENVVEAPVRSLRHLNRVVTAGVSDFLSSDSGRRLSEQMAAEMSSGALMAPVYLTEELVKARLKSLVTRHARHLAIFFGLRVALTSLSLALAKALLKRLVRRLGWRPLSATVDGCCDVLLPTSFFGPLLGVTNGTLELAGVSDGPLAVLWLRHFVNLGLLFPGRTGGGGGEGSGTGEGGGHDRAAAGSYAATQPALASALPRVAAAAGDAMGALVEQAAGGGRG